MPRTADRLRLSPAARPILPRGAVPYRGEHTKASRSVGRQSTQPETEAGIALVIRVIEQIAVIERMQGEEAALEVVENLKRMMARA
jgi:hypothetical protein